MSGTLATLTWDHPASSHLWSAPSKRLTSSPSIIIAARSSSSSSLSCRRPEKSTMMPGPAVLTGRSAGTWFLHLCHPGDQVASSNNYSHYTGLLQGRYWGSTLLGPRLAPPAAGMVPRALLSALARPHDWCWPGAVCASTGFPCPPTRAVEADHQRGQGSEAVADQLDNNQPPPLCTENQLWNA